MSEVTAQCISAHIVIVPLFTLFSMSLPSLFLHWMEENQAVKLGREEPAMSMDANGKIIWAKHSEVQQANLKAMGDAEIKDGISSTQQWH